jgi:hypothetical protein
MLASVIVFAQLCSEVLWVGASKWSNMVGKGTRNLSVVTSKMFETKPGQGWCVDQAGLEGTARKVASVTCQGAQNWCETDTMCVAFGCESSSGLSVLLHHNRLCSQLRQGRLGAGPVLDPQLIAECDQGQADVRRVVKQSVLCPVCYDAPFISRPPGKRYLISGKFLVLPCW